MPAKIYRVKLTESERSFLTNLTKAGTINARKLKRVRILLLADESDSSSCKKDDEICKILECTGTTTSRIRQRFFNGGIEKALNEKPRPGQPKKLTGKEEAKIITLACTEAPEGYARWSLRLLAGKQVELGIKNPVSYLTIRETLKKR